MEFTSQLQAGAKGSGGCTPRCSDNKGPYSHGRDRKAARVRGGALPSIPAASAGATAASTAVGRSRFVSSRHRPPPIQLPPAPPPLPPSQSSVRAARPIVPRLAAAPSTAEGWGPRSRAATRPGAGHDGGGAGGGAAAGCNGRVGGGAGGAEVGLISVAVRVREQAFWCAVLVFEVAALVVKIGVGCAMDSAMDV